jgi:restriction system protein
MRTVALSGVDGMTGVQFEAYVKKVLESRGYLCSLTPHSYDLGVDLVASGNGHKIGIQCKRSARHISRRAVADVHTGKAHYGCETGMVVTNSYFTPSAQALARETGTSLVDRETLAVWIEHFQAKG